MKRREFIQAGAAGAAGVLLAKPALAGRKPAPDYMPIVKQKMESGDYRPCYEERELTEPVLLCDGRGRLNPEAIGWSRLPLVRANLSGHWPRKKRWNFWNWICPEFVFSVTIADIDYGSFCAVSFTDFETMENRSGIALRTGGFTAMPEEVEKSIAWKTKNIDYVFDHRGSRILVSFRGKSGGGEQITADFVIHKPEGHETLNIVAPWSSERFQMNSKHNTLPCEGSVTVGDKRYVMDPDRCHGVQDFGRGMWPYRSYWNWGVGTGRQGQDVVGINIGAKWTTGTGSNENGLCVNGRLQKIMEDLEWDYDPADWMKPWRARTTCSDLLDITLTPIIANTQNLSLGLVGTGGTCSFGLWNGLIRFEGREIQIKNLIGWAEEFQHRW